MDKLDQEFLYVNTLPAGGGGAGDRGNIGGYRIAKFIRIENKVMLTLPNYDYRAISKNPYETKLVEESFPQSIIWGFVPLVIEGDKVLIDITAFLMRDSHKVADRIGKSPSSFFAAANRAPGAAYRIDESRSSLYMANTKNFPKNTEFEAMLTFSGSGAAERSYFSGGPGTAQAAPDPSSVTIRTHQSFIELPDNKYKPRVYDPRSGFNSMDYFDFATPLDQPLVKKFVRRWRLEKKNPDEAFSEVVKPIVYYVDRGAPEDVKKALMEGGSWWNQAFEAAGFKNAFQVKEMPEGADPMDIRYSVVNWVHRPTRGYSNGVGIFDPRTGEIIKGEVSLGSMRDRQDFLIFQGLKQIYGDDKNANQLAVDMALARIRQLSAHEIAHTLGFYHNHLASVNDRASVTDYPFPRVTLKPNGQVDISDAYAKNIGSWDKRAVIWAYTQFPEGADEKAGLEKIMQESLKENQVFMFDLTVHPQTAQWDNGDDPSAELLRLMTVRKKVLADFSEKAIPVGSPMATMEEVLVPVYLLHRYQIDAAAHVLGGLDFRYALRGDGQIPTRLIAPKDQWKAFDALMSTITPEALALPEKLIRQLAPYPEGYSRTKENFQGYTGVTFDPVGAAESIAGVTLSCLLDAERAARLVEYHSRDAAQPGLLAVIDRLTAQTWKANPLSGYKGQLQKMVKMTMLKKLLALAANAPDHVRSQAMAEVNSLKKWMINAEAAATDMELKGDYLFGLQQISQFEKNPDKFQPAPVVLMPAGAPIG
ncbi:zinc-dependent metalloprotease [Pedobacter sp. MC2016-15]|uniref:zinc-dependent metalloprotease n=1 Tax=Pedobacter sp. MC2016-15 TaxID=2994473 RepID=UPI002248469D|nr:zinc-dependent metalloprotease [Pedobacter sp. MC2016-15]MCX2477554.1 zinc-dependent metalloprotease [Pedobacter sp. MC2016-15]